MKLTQLLRKYAGIKCRTNTANAEPNRLPDNVNNWPEEWREAYRERVAIMEFDGGLERQKAEQCAERLQREAYTLQILIIEDNDER